MLNDCADHLDRVWHASASVPDPDMDCGALSELDFTKRAFLEVGGDPELIKLRYGHQTLPGLDILTDLGGLLTNDAVHRRIDARVS